MPRVQRIRSACVCMLAAWSCLVSFGQNRATLPLDQLTSYSAEPRAVAPLDDESARLLTEARNALRQDLPLHAAKLLNQLTNGPAGESFEVNLELAVVNESFEFYTEALSFAENAIAVRPDDARANVLLARLQLTLQDPPDTYRESALKHLLTAARGPDEQANLAEVTHAWLLVAQVLQADGYRSAALEAWQTFDLTIWETFPEHRNYQPLADFLSRFPRGGFEARRELLEAEGDEAAVLALLEEALRREPRSTDLQRMRLAALRGAGKADQAFELAVQQLDQGDLATSLPLALSAAIEADRLGSWVTEVLTKLDDPRQRKLARALLRSLNRRGAPEAEQIARALVERDAGDVEAAVGLFAAQVDGGEAQQAVTLLTRMFRANEKLDLPERYRRTIFDRCQGALRDGDPDELLRAEIDDYATRFVRALLLEGRGADGFEALYEQVRGEQPSFGPAYVQSVLRLQNGYAWDASLALAEAYDANARRHASAAYLLAVSLAGLDRNQDAEESFRKAIERDANEPAYSLALGNHCRRLSDHRCAQRFYRESFVLDGSEQAFEGLIEAYLRDGKRAVAEREVEQLTDEVLSPDARRRVTTMIRYLDRPFSQTHLDELAEQLETHPDDVLTIRMYAAGLYANRLGGAGIPPEEALQWIQYAHSLTPTDEELTLEVAQMLRLQARFAEAGAVIAPLLERFPNRQRVLRDYSTNLLAAFDWEQGLDVLERLAALEEEEDRMQRQQQIIGLCLEAGYTERAERLLDQLTEDGYGEELTATRLDLLYALGREGEAYQAARTYYELDPTNPGRRSMVYNAGMVMEDYEQLEEWITNWQAGAREPLTWVEMLVRVRIAREQFDKAREAADMLLEGQNMDDAIARRILLGQIAMQEGNRELAGREFEALLDERQVNEAQKRYIWSVWVEGLGRQGAFDEALEVVDRWSRTRFASQVDIRNARLGVLQTAGRDAEQIPLLEARFIDNMRTGAYDPGSYNDLGYTMADQGLALEESEEKIRYAVSLDPLNAAYLDSMGWVAYKLGRFGEARDWLENAIQLRAGRTDATMFDHLGDVHWRLYETDLAVRAWECAAELLDENDEPSPRDLRLRQLLRRKLQAVANGGEPQLAPVGEE